MEQILSELSIDTPGEGFIDITSAIKNWIANNKIQKGILVLFTKHTSCSLTINENADPRVLKDLSSYMKALVPEEGVKPISGKGDSISYTHDDEGVDDMPAHIRTTLTCSSLSLSINESELVLGTWQAIYLWEHRYSRHTRQLCLHAIGEVQEVNPSLTSESNSKLITRTNASKLNEVVLQRHNPTAWAEDGGNETNLDLLIDRIHDLTSEVNSMNRKGET